MIRSLARLAVMATFISVCALIIVLCVMNGFNQNIEKKLLAVEPHVTVEGLSADQALALANYQNKNIESQIQVSEQDVLIRTVDGLFSGAIARGLNTVDVENFLARVLQTKGETSGLPFTIELEPGEVVLGAELAKGLNVYHGDQVTLIPPESLLLPSGEIPNLERVRVKAILQTDVPGFDSKLLIYNRQTSLKRMGKSSTLKNLVELRLFEPRTYQAVAADLMKNISIPEASISSWASRNSSLFFALRLERIAMMSLLGLSVLITSFSIIMVLLIFIAEKQKDIGLMMALGLSGRQTKILFGKIGLMLALTGSLAGLVIGTSVSLFIEKYPLKFMPDFYVDTTLPSRVDISDIVICFLGILTISLIATSWPIWRAMRLTPAEALKGQTAFRRLR